VTRKTTAEFGIPTTRGPSFLSRLEKEAAKYQAAGIVDRVLLCFTCDPYQPLDVVEQVTRHTIQILHRHGLPVQILTKGGSRSLRDLDLFGPADAFAATLTFLDEAESRKWEPKAALPRDRIDTLEAFHAAGIPTWVSLEPVISPVQSLSIIHRTHEFVDLFKVGTLNYHPVARTIDWRVFAHKAVELLMSLGYTEIQADDQVLPGQKAFYIKNDLKRYLA
jgi:DNA repair photolyase